jgi:hypothetical protein
MMQPMYVSNHAPGRKAKGHAIESLKHETHERPSFSRCSHFTLVLLPAMVAVAIALMSSPSGGPLLRFGIYGLFLFSIGGPLGLLYVAGVVEDWEDKNLH